MENLKKKVGFQEASSPTPADQLRYIDMAKEYSIEDLIKNQELIYNPQGRNSLGVVRSEHQPQEVNVSDSDIVAASKRPQLKALKIKKPMDLEL